MTRLIDADVLSREFDDIIKCNAGFVKDKIRKAPTVEAYSKGAVEQIMWERDMAIQQLNDYGVQFGEQADCVRVVRCRDCVNAHESPFIVGDELLECEKICSEECLVNANFFCAYGERRDGD